MTRTRGDRCDAGLPAFLLRRGLAVSMCIGGQMYRQRAKTTPSPDLTLWITNASCTCDSRRGRQHPMMQRRVARAMR